MYPTDTMLDCGGDALRHYEQGGRKLRAWPDLPKATKKNWREKARVVLKAAGVFDSAADKGGMGLA